MSTSSTYIKIVKPRSTPQDAPTKSSTPSKAKIQEDLEKEFCPPLDSALVAALLMETQDPSEHAILKLKSTLKQLATMPDDNVTNSSSFASPERPDGGEQDDSTSLPKSLSRSSSSQGFYSNSFSSPIGFLRAAFPNLATNVLEKTLRSHGWSSEAFYTGDDGPGLDMDAIINDLLSEEWYAENEDGNPENDRDAPWEMARRPRRIQSGNVDTNVIRPRRGKRHKPEPIPLFDTLQRRRFPIPRPSVVPDTEALDPWSFVDSLAMYLSTLLPRATYSQLLSLFHNPSHATPNEALRAYLDAPLLASTQRSRSGIIDMDLQALFELMSVRPDDENVRGNLDCDAKACLKAVDGDVNKAYDLLVLLRDLDVNAAAIHRSFRPTKPSLLELSGVVQPKSAVATTSSFGIPSMAPRLSHSVLASPLPVKSAPPSSDTWTVVDKKRPKNTTPEPPAVGVPSRQTSSRPNGRDSSERNPGTPEECRRKADALQLRRKQALNQASIHWRKRNRLGGEVALYYAEKARDLDAESRSWALRGARTQVEIDAHRRFGDGTTIDVHGLTVDEGVVVARQHVSDWWTFSQTGDNAPRTFTIITGVGNHSAGPGKLGPALEYALRNDGWDVRKEYGKLVITGARRSSGGKR